MALPNTPLFQVASQAAQKAIRRQFERSEYGQLIRNVKRSVGNASVDRQVKIALAKYKRASNPVVAVKSMMGAELKLLNK